MTARLESTAVLSYQTPFPADHWPLLWAWLHEYPDCNFDDDGPKTCEALVAGREATATMGECTWLVLADGVPCGFLSFQSMTTRLGMTRGICFAKAVHGSGIPKRAIREWRDHLFGLGIRKICAAYYEHNVRVSALLRSLGAVPEGRLAAQVTQDGQPVAMMLTALFAPEESCQQGD